MDKKPAEVFHPGEHIIDELCERWWSSKYLSRISGISFNKLGGILEGTADIDSDVANSLSRIFGTSSEYWMNLQRAWDERDKLKITHDDGTVTKVKPLQMWTPE
jgi:HTH-type transcriptional regulator/antitoxin HigA